MISLTATSLPSLSDWLPALMPSLAAGATAEGIVLLLQGVACVLVSLAALSVLLHFRSAGSRSRGCGCSGGNHAQGETTTVTGDMEGGHQCCRHRHNGAAASGVADCNSRAADGAATQNISPASSDQTAAAPCAASSADAADEQRRITAVIAAAVHNVLGGQPHRIVRIEPLNQSWAQEGRRDIFFSHRIR